MSTLTTVNQFGIAPKEYQGQMVVTFKDIDAVHERKEGTARNNFAQNRDKFIEGLDFWKIPRNELSGLKPQNSNMGNPKLPVTLLTQSGYLMIVKTFGDKKSWNIQRTLVDNYFNRQSELSTPNVLNPEPSTALIPAQPTTPVPSPSSELNPQLQMFKALFDDAIIKDVRLKEVESKIEQVEKRINSSPNFEIPETTQALDSLFLNPVTLYTTTDIGKAFNISAQAVNRFLLAQNIHSPHKNGWRLHAQYDDCDYVFQKVGKFGDDEHLMTWWTATGKDFVCALLKNAGLNQKKQVKAYDRHVNRGKRKKSKSKK